MKIRVRKIRRTCERWPTQYEGELSDGTFFYFRARSGRWDFTVGDTLDLAVSGLDPVGVRFIIAGPDKTQGEMSHAGAETLIAWCIETYERGRNRFDTEQYFGRPSGV